MVLQTWIFFFLVREKWLPRQKVLVCRTTFLEPLFYTFLETWLQIKWLHGCYFTWKYYAIYIPIRCLRDLYLGLIILMKTWKYILTTVLWLPVGCLIIQVSLKNFSFRREQGEMHLKSNERKLNCPSYLTKLRYTLTFLKGVSIKSLCIIYFSAQVIERSWWLQNTSRK